MNTTSTTETETTSVERPGSFLTRLIDKVTLGANARMIYGEPVEHDGVVVIPVGKLRWALGGGEGRDSAEESSGSGSGGGGGILMSPVGFIEIKDGTARFKPVFDPALIVQIIVASALALVLLQRGVSGIIREARYK
jgi:uncharacterized spore protein YtfJ